MSDWKWYLTQGLLGLGVAALLLWFPVHPSTTAAGPSLPALDPGTTLHHCHQTCSHAFALFERGGNRARELHHKGCIVDCINASSNGPETMQYLGRLCARCEAAGGCGCELIRPFVSTIVH